MINEIIDFNVFLLNIKKCYQILTMQAIFQTAQQISLIPSNNLDFSAELSV